MDQNFKLQLSLKTKFYLTLLIGIAFLLSTLNYILNYENNELDKKYDNSIDFNEAITPIRKIS